MGLLYKADGDCNYDWEKHTGSREADLRLANEELNWASKDVEIRCQWCWERMNGDLAMSKQSWAVPFLQSWKKLRYLHFIPHTVQHGNQFTS